MVIFQLTEMDLTAIAILPEARTTVTNVVAERGNGSLALPVLHVAAAASVVLVPTVLTTPRNLVSIANEASVNVAMASPSVAIHLDAPCANLATAVGGSRCREATAAT